MLKVTTLQVTRNAGSSDYAVSAVMQKWSEAVRLSALVAWRQRPWVQDPALTALLRALDDYHARGSRHA